MTDQRIEEIRRIWFGNSCLPDVVMARETIGELLAELDRAKKENRQLQKELIRAGYEPYEVDALAGIEAAE